MSRTNDNWERLVDATLKREELRYVALYCDSFSSSTSTSPAFTIGPFRHDLDGSPSKASDSEIPVPLRPDPRHIAYKELKAATKSFRPSWIIGSGSFGNVYKGWIEPHNLTAAKPRNGTPVAVKKLNPQSFRAEMSIKGRDEWSTEIGYLRHLHHPNVVKLIGYSSEKDILLVVYEFMPKGSLDHHLFKNKLKTLSWTTRIKVATGAAKGLAFLHGLEKQIILRNVGPSTILLDGEFNVKLTGLGLATDGPSCNATHVSTQVIGSYGYTAPEYVATGNLTARCDVYGFGVVLLELLCGRRVIDKQKPAMEQDLVQWTRPFLSDGKKMLKIMDPKLKARYPKKEAHSVAILAYRCLCLNAEERPCMSEVLVEFERLQGRSK